MREAPESVAIGLRAIKPEIHLRWNPQAKMVRTTFDVYGIPQERIFEPRWEVWDTDTQGHEYCITVVQTEDGEFMEPDQRLVDMLAMCNPARWGGDVRRMVRALVDEPNERREASEERSWSHLSEEIGRDAHRMERPTVLVDADIH